MPTFASRIIAMARSNGHLRSSTDARVLIVSQRALRPLLSRCTLYEMEDVIADIDDVDILELQPRERALRGPAGRVVGAVQDRAGWHLEPDPRPEPVELDQDYEILYFHAENLEDLQALQAVQDWRRRCRIAICRVEEVWLQWLPHHKELQLLRPFDHVFLGCQATAPSLEQAVGVPTRYVAPATDVARLTPLPHQPERVIDCLWIGRRAERTHAALLELSRRRRGSFYYVFDTRLGNNPVYAPAEHREFLADQIQRARYFVANYPKANAADHTGGQREVGYRFFEGAAGGAVMIGHAPDCPSYHENFDWPNAVIRLDYDSPDVATLLEELDSRHEEMARLRLTNAVQSLRRHDYAHRWAEMLRFAGAEPPPRLQARVDRLNAIADAAEADVAEEAETSISGVGLHVPNR